MIHISQPAKFGLLNQANNNFRRPPEGQNNYPSYSLVEVTNTSFAYFSFSTPKQQMFKTKRMFLFCQTKSTFHTCFSKVALAPRKFFQKIYLMVEESQK